MFPITDPCGCFDPDSRLPRNPLLPPVASAPAVASPRLPRPSGSAAAGRPGRLAAICPIRVRVAFLAWAWLGPVLMIGWLPEVFGADLAWTNLNGGDWGVAANWSPNQVPGPADNVLITNHGTYTVRVNTGATIGSFALGGSSGTQTLTNSVFTLNVTNIGMVGANGVLGLAGGTMAGGGSLAVQGRFIWAGGMLSGTGVRTIAPGGSMAITGSATKIISGGAVLVNAAQVAWSEGLIRVGLGSVISNAPGATFDLLADVSFEDWSGVHATHNAGLWRKLGGSGTTTLIDTFNNTGTVEVHSGTFRLTGTGTSTGRFVISGGAVLDYGGGTHSLAGGSSVGGAGTLLVSGGAVNFAGDVTGPSPVVLSGGNLNATTVGGISLASLVVGGGTLAGTGPVVVTGPLTWTNGGFGGSGLVHANAGLAIRGPATKTTRGRILVNMATATWSEGPINVGSGAGVVCALSNAPGAVFELKDDVSYVNGSGGITTLNAGLLVKSGGTGISSLVDDFHNSGRVEVRSGTLRFNTPSDGTHTGPFVVSAGAQLEFAGGTHELSHGSSLTGGHLAISSGALNVANGVRAEVDSLLISGGSLGGTGTLVASGLTTWTGGTLAGAGAVVFNGGLKITGAETKSISTRTVVNTGSATWNEGFIRIGLGGTFSNAPGAVFDIAFDGSFIDNGGANTTINAGWWRKTAGSGASGFVEAFHNTGTLEIQSGAMHFQGFYSQTAGHTLLRGGNITNNTPLRILGGTLAGSGFISGSVTNSGIVSPGASPGQLTVLGDYTQTIGGTLQVEVGGPEAGTEHDRLVVGGIARLDGALLATTVEGFRPDNATAFTILTGNLRVNQFRTLASQPGARIQASYDATSAAVRFLEVRLALTPAVSTLDAGQTRNFSALGGALPYAFSLAANHSGASINPVTGVYTAGATTGAMDTVRVTDADGNQAHAFVQVGGSGERLLVVTTTNDSGSGSLRAAIEEANRTVGQERPHILFNIPGSPPYTIVPLGVLPTITRPTILNATSQPGYAGQPLVELDGTSATAMQGAVSYGLSITAGDCVVRGLVINRFVTGLYVLGPGGNSFEGNFIGTDTTGMTGPLAVGGGFTRQDAGMVLGSPNNRVGGTTPAHRNLISGNRSVGILTDGNATNTFILGNWIGPAADGTSAVGGQVEGLRLNGANSVVTGNLISLNGGPGVRIPLSSGILIRSNSIFANQEMGIGFGAYPGAPVPNDPADPDEGPNHLQNFPILTVVRNSGTAPRLLGVLNSTPNAAFTLEFFASSECDPSGYGEGQRAIGLTEVITDASGNAAFDYFVSGEGTLGAGEVVTATATAADNSTSAFSPCVSVSSGSIAGLVRSGSVPLPGVTITASNPVTATLIATRTTDALGAFRFDPLPVNGNYVLTPNRPGFSFSPASQVFSGLHGEATANFQFSSLLPAGTLRGRVSAADGRPVAGVSIRVVDLANKPPTTDRQTQTHADGTYELGDLPVDRMLSVTPSLRSAVFSPAARQISLAPGSGTASFLFGVGHHISGRVEVVSGVPGIFSVSFVDAFGRVIDRVTTDANGDYVSAPLPAGQSYRVRPSNSAYGFRPVERAVPDLRNDLSGINFSAGQDTRAIRGTVVNTLGQGIGGVTVVATRPDLPTFQLITETSGDGTFTFPEMPDLRDYFISAWSRDPLWSLDDLFGQFAPESAEVPVNGADPEEVTFTETPRRWVSGQVLTDTHEPIQGALVEIYNSASSFLLARPATGSNGVFFANVPVDVDLLVAPVNASEGPAYVFAPESLAVERATNPVALSFVGHRAPVVSGSLTSKAGFRLPQVSMALGGPAPVSEFSYDLDGYRVALESRKPYTLAPKRENFRFAPTSENFHLGDADERFDFTGQPFLPLRGRIAYRDVSGEARFMVMNADTSEPVQVPRRFLLPTANETSSSGSCGPGLDGFFCNAPESSFMDAGLALPTVSSSPSLSPDGRMIAFWSGALVAGGYAEATGALKFRTVNDFLTPSPATDPGSLFDTSYMDVIGRIGWSPDSAWLAFARRTQGGEGIYVASANGGAVELIPGTGAQDSSPSWSPDGRRLAFTRRFNDQFDVFVVATDGSELQRVTTSLADELDPAWSPDGTRIAFASNRDGNFEIYVMEASGVNQLRRTFHPADDAEPVWSPDGTMLAFERTEPGTLNDTHQIFAMMADGTLETRLVTGRGPSWSETPEVATPAGNQVTVQDGAVSIIFGDVTSRGSTTIVPVASSVSTRLPPGFFVIPGANAAFEVATTAGFTPPITVRFTLAGYDDPGSFAALRILHSENGALLDRTILTGPDAPNYEARTICARVSTLSPFQLAHLQDSSKAVIQGTVLDTAGAPVSSARLLLNGAMARQAITDAYGKFTFANLPTNANYTLMPADAHYEFSPGVRFIRQPSGTNTALFVAAVPAAPVLTVIRDAATPERLSLSWPATGWFLALESSPSLAAPRWLQVAGLPRTLGTNQVLSVEATNTARYFRLQRP